MPLKLGQVTFKSREDTAVAEVLVDSIDPEMLIVDAAPTLRHWLGTPLPAVLRELQAAGVLVSAKWIKRPFLWRIGIIGSAGRRQDADLMNRAAFELIMGDMFLAVTDFRLDVRARCEDVVAVSGGAAWSDHAAVMAYLLEMVGHLHLYLPAAFDLGRQRFTNQGVGRRANELHEVFAVKVGRSPFTDIARAIEKGARVWVRNGFKARNLDVGQVDCLLAWTWHSGPDPRPGSGTAHTWANSTAQTKRHFDLHRSGKGFVFEEEL